jgi:hypothetical protein
MGMEGSFHTDTGYNGKKRWKLGDFTSAATGGQGYI